MRGLPINEKRRLFVEIASKFETSFTEAARMAGYCDANNEIQRLLADPLIGAELLRALQPKFIKFQALNAKAFAALDYILSPDNWKSVGTTQNGTPVYEVTARDRVAAALGWLKVVSEVSPDSLQEKARDADKSESLRDLSDRVLSEHFDAIEGKVITDGEQQEVQVIDIDAELVAPSALSEPDDLPAPPLPKPAA